MEWVAGWGLRLIALGLASGLLVTLALSPTLESFLFGVRASDGLTMLAVIGGVAIVGTIGILGPVSRAMRIDPIDVLRSQ
jgi:ABC-type antimicrobial peptide transport system permease subunit